MSGKIPRVFEITKDKILDFTQHNFADDSLLYNKLQSIGIITIECPCCKTIHKIPNPFLGMSISEATNYNNNHKIICDTDNVFIPMYKIHDTDDRIAIESSVELKEFEIHFVNSIISKIEPEQYITHNDKHIYIFYVGNINNAVLYSRTKCTYTLKFLDTIDI